MNDKDKKELDCSEMHFDLSEEEEVPDEFPGFPLSRSWDEGRHMTKCGSCGASYEDGSVPKKCECGAEGDFYWA